MYRTITAQAVETFLLENARSHRWFKLLRYFVGTEARHERRLQEVLASLVKKNVVMEIDGPSVAAASFGVQLAEAFDLPVSEKRYFHVLNAHTIIQDIAS